MVHSLKLLQKMLNTPSAKLRPFTCFFRPSKFKLIVFTVVPVISDLKDTNKLAQQRYISQISPRGGTPSEIHKETSGGTIFQQIKCFKR